MPLDCSGFEQCRDGLAPTAAHGSPVLAGRAVRPPHTCPAPNRALPGCSVRCRVRMDWTQLVFIDCQRPLEERLSLRILALRLIKPSQCSLKQLQCPHALSPAAVQRALAPAGGAAPPLHTATFLQIPSGETQKFRCFNGHELCMLEVRRHTSAYGVAVAPTRAKRER